MNDIIGKFAVIIFGIPFVFYIAIAIIALKMDNMSQTYIDNAVVEFVDNARASARITPEAYENMAYKISVAHSPCEIKIWHSAKYVNPGEESDGRYDALTYNEDYGKEYIFSKMYPDNYTSKDYLLKEGDYIKVTVQNETPTLGARLAGILLPGYNKNSLFTSYGGYVGNDTQ